MIYADADFYRDNYLLGRAETIPLAEFGFWSRKAGAYLDTATFGRIDRDNVPEEVKLCACEVAEAYYTDNDNRQTDNIKSESVDGHSVTYADQRLDDAAMIRSLKRILVSWLSGTGLLYRGC